MSKKRGYRAPLNYLQAGSHQPSCFYTVDFPVSTLKCMRASSLYSLLSVCGMFTMISGPAGCDHFRNKVALLALLFKHNNCGFSESKDSKQEIRSLHQKITGMHLVWTVEMSISCSWASQFLSSFIRRNYKFCFKSSCQQSHYLLFGFALSFTCLKLTPKISQRIISQRTSVVISFCQTAVPWPRGMSERRGPGRERLFKLERLGVGKYKERTEQTERDTRTWRDRIQTCESVHTCLIVSVRSERRTVGGIKKFIWTVPWGMFVSLTTAGTAKQTGPFITIQNKQKLY